ncbi:hypothetical protein [Sphingobium vermicomposti]|uniref:hypothetical protein n=1 Tax=Sphingobium vermicomposti TaxID=529005 RepID=UPI00142055EC|nr:hypothetical protein [Sphingobium vermicomposti]
MKNYRPLKVGTVQTSIQRRHAVEEPARHHNPRHGIIADASPFEPVGGFGCDECNAAERTTGGDNNLIVIAIRAKRVLDLIP